MIQFLEYGITIETTISIGNVILARLFNMIKQRLEQDLLTAVSAAGFQPTDIVLSISENPNFGDYTSNIALQLAKQKPQNGKHSTRDVANEILKKFGHPSYLERVEVAGAGFINFFIKDEVLLKNLGPGKEKPTNDQRPTTKRYLVEYGHVNPLKEIHIGHLRTFILGESICRILEFLGNEVFRANYQGDIGLHIAKAIWGLRKIGLPSKKLTLEEKAKFLGKAYSEGNRVYEEDEAVKKEINDINIKLYQKAPELDQIYHTTRDWSLEYFEPRYETLGVKYDRCFFESEVYEKGKQIVLDNVGEVFKESEGAIIFPGEKYARLPDGQGLHNRVFVTQAGNPTYEAKEIGLAKLEYQSFNYDRAIHVVANEQEGYFKVVFKAINLLFPEVRGKKYHLSYGLVDVKEGKMSSRTGEVITMDELIGVVKERVREVMMQSRLSVDQDVATKVALGAIKFAYLKFAPKTNAIIDLEKSVSLQGDSGPYVQYSFARTQSLLKHVGKSGSSSLVASSLEEKNQKPVTRIQQLESEEREVLRWLEYFELMVEQAASELRPNLIGEYLINLSKAFNLFYQKYPIVKSKESFFRLALTRKVGETLKIGLNLLGIEAPEKM